MAPPPTMAHEIEDLGSALQMDGLLRFAPRVAERYERERGLARVAALRHLIVVGLALYNVYDVTGLLLMPDIAWPSIVLRSFVVTPGSLLLAWGIAHLAEQPREWLVAGGMVNAFGAAVLLFWASGAPLAGYTFGELPLILVFGNMLLALRFRQAIVFTGIAFLLAAGAAVTKAGLDDGVRGAFVLQMATGCLFSLYANYRLEAVRCRAYLAELGARLKAEAAETARNRFLDLSMTDALTGLPNRRALDESVLRWAGEHGSIAVLMIDVDHFKAFNDSLGHPAGDESLRAIAAALRDAAPAADHLLARFGGEEFTLVVPGLDPFSAARQGADLVRAVHRLGLPHPARRDGERVVTISVGVAVSADAAAWAEAFRAADGALYEAKRAGRNRSALASPAPDGPASADPDASRPWVAQEMATPGRDGASPMAALRIEA